MNKTYAFFFRKGYLTSIFSGNWDCEYEEWSHMQQLMYEWGRLWAKDPDKPRLYVESDFKGAAIATCENYLSFTLQLEEEQAILRAS